MHTVSSFEKGADDLGRKIVVVLHRVKTLFIRRFLFVQKQFFSRTFQGRVEYFIMILKNAEAVNVLVEKNYNYNFKTTFMHAYSLFFKQGCLREDGLLVCI